MKKGKREIRVRKVVEVVEGPKRSAADKVGLGTLCTAAATEIGGTVGDAIQVGCRQVKLPTRLVCFSFERLLLFLHVAYLKERRQTFCNIAEDVGRLDRFPISLCRNLNVNAY